MARTTHETLCTNGFVSQRKNDFFSADSHVLTTKTGPGPEGPDFVTENSRPTLCASPTCFQQRPTMTVRCTTENDRMNVAAEKCSSQAVCFVAHAFVLNCVLSQVCTYRTRADLKTVHRSQSTMKRIVGGKLSRRVASAWTAEMNSR